MPISKRKLAANRRNAQKSTGPTSAEGKERVSQNAVQHGLCGRFHVPASENRAEYENLLQRFLEAEQPADQVERELVAKMARHTWLSERSIRFQEACFLFQPQTPDQQDGERQTVAILKGLDLYLRYQAAQDRAYQRAANELAKRRKERALAERGFVSQKRAEAAEVRAQAEEKRRDKRQNQRDELHAHKLATAEWQQEQRLERLFKQMAACQAADSSQMHPQTAQIAA